MLSSQLGVLAARPIATKRRRNTLLTDATPLFWKSLQVPLCKRLQGHEIRSLIDFQWKTSRTPARFDLGCMQNTIVCAKHESDLWEWCFADKVREFECNVCGKAYSEKRRLDAHHAQHFGERYRRSVVLPATHGTILVMQFDSQNCSC